MCFFGKKRKAKREAKKLAKIEAEQKAAEEKASQISNEKKAQEKPKVEETSKKEVRGKTGEKPVAKASATNSPDKDEVKKPKPVSKEENDIEDEDDNNENFKYHVSLNRDEKSANFKEWRVRKSGSKKTIKHFKTQLEAIEYAEHLAEQAGTTIVIHRRDGKIRKQDYSKK